MTTNLMECIVGACREPEKAAVIWRGQEVSYQHLFALAEVCAQGYIERGWGRGRRVLLCLDDTPATLAAFLGALWIGAVPVLLNPKLGLATMQHVMADSAAVGVIHQSGNQELVASAARLAHGPEGVAIELFCPFPGTALGPRAGAAPEFCRLSFGEDAFWQYTSGTTGKPKAVRHHGTGMIASNELFARTVLGISASDRIYSSAKLFFGYGLGNSLFFTLLCGATALIDDRWPTTESTLENLAAFRPTVFFSVPSLYNQLLSRASDLVRFTGPGARFCSAGSQLPAALFLRWQSHGVEILDGIGATEMGHIFLCNRPGEARPGSTGRVVPGYELRLLDAQGVSVPDETRGVLWVRGPSVSLGYHNLPNETQERFVDGWYRTGDIFSRSASGHYTHLGREDDLFKSNGRWVAPAEIEGYVLEEFPEVTEAALVPVMDDDGLEVPSLCLVLGGQALNGAERETFEIRVHEALRRSFESYKRPRRLFFLPKLPRNENGKLVRTQLAASLRQPNPASHGADQNVLTRTSSAAVV